MRVGRLILTVTILALILVFPLVGQEALQILKSPAVQAASGGAAAPTDLVYRNDNDDDNDNDGSGNDNDSDDNDNSDLTCYASMNSNEEVPCDFLANENQGGPSPSRGRQDSQNRPTMCFDTRQVGVVQLGTGSYDVTVAVMPHSSFGQTTRLTLRAVDPASVPAVPGALVDSVVFALDAQSDCSGAAIGTLPNLVNLGITYNVTPAVDKARLQIAHLEGGSWANVTTVPDPVMGNPYVSTTIGLPGTYALFQK